MNYAEYAFGRYETDIAVVAKKYELNLNDLEVESFSPGRLAILVEKRGEKRFKIHINLEENRIIAVKQMTDEAIGNGGDDQFAKYKSFMK
jgi:hypothetical protein